MRLLKRDETGRVSFTKFLSEAELPGYRYAILSHTWGKDEEEVTFEDILNGNGTTKPGIGSAKIRFCVDQTERDELEYFWIDACCIDKRNSVELDRSLRSMFRWYAKAEKCYVYLSGLPRRTEELESSWEKAFMSHRWFRRGWTLQELIAPITVEFFSSDGIRLGSRLSLEKQINQITNIPVAALRGNALTQFTVVERKQWQEGRETREPEDLVYSLLGLLDVSMPVQYGEGRAKAWERLEGAMNESRKGTRHADFSLGFNVPGVIETSHFVARRRELEEMRIQLAGDGRRRYVVMQGLGGIGKTQLVIAYALCHRDDYSAIFWLDATSEDSLKSSFVRVARQILQRYPSAPSLAGLDLQRNLGAVVNGVHIWLGLDMNNRWLMIFDNHDNPRVPEIVDETAFDIRKYLPDSYQGSVIITSRSSEVRLGYFMPIKKLEVLEGLQILEYSSQRGELAQDTSAVELATKLDGLPLALTTAGAYLSQNAVTFAEYIEMFDKSWAKLQTLSPSLSTYENRAMFSTWQISFEQIERRSTTAANLLRLWAYFDHRDLWYELLAHLQEQDVEWMRTLTFDKVDFHGFMRVLCNHGLAEARGANEFGVESIGYSVHTVVHAWMSAVLNPELDRDLARAALHCVARHIPRVKEQDWSLLQRRLLQHVDKCVSVHPENAGNNIYLGSVYGSFGKLYCEQGKLAEAEELFVRELRVNEEALGANHKSTLYSVNNLGVVYFRQGRLAQAELTLMRALRGYEEAPGANHKSASHVFNNLGLLYANQGRTAAAEQMYMRAIKGREQALGPDHISALQSVANLGDLYKVQGKLAVPEEMWVRALKGYKSALGVDHTSTLHTVHSLANLYSYLGKLAEAEQTHVQTLRWTERALGGDHTSTLDVVTNLGNLYAHQGRLVEAEELLTQALRGYEKASDSNHTSMLQTAHSLANLYRYQDKPAEAEQTYVQTLIRTERALGADHTSTLDIVANLGNLYAHQGKLAEAEEFTMRALLGHEKVLGANHMSTLFDVMCLSALRLCQLRLDESGALLERVKQGYLRLSPRNQYYADQLERRLSRMVNNRSRRVHHRWKSWFKRKESV